MANIQIVDLSLAGSELFSGSEGFMSDLSDKELNNVMGSGRCGGSGRSGRSGRSAVKSISNSVSNSYSTRRSGGGCTPGTPGTPTPGTPGTPGVVTPPGGIAG